jgi:hypothetical protein
LISKIYSFSRLSFAINRPLKLFLRHNSGLKYLDERAFSTVLSNGDTIDLYDTILECDCRMYWIYKDKSYESLLLDAICTNGKSLYDDEEAFVDCVN